MISDPGVINTNALRAWWVTWKSKTWVYSSSKDNAHKLDAAPRPGTGSISTSHTPSRERACRLELPLQVLSECPVH